MTVHKESGCENVRPLVPVYLDGELSEAQAAPLRKHLLACQPCRAQAQSEKNLRRWLVPAAAVGAPRGFSARVAQAAFAGVGAAGNAGEYAEREEREAPALLRREASILPFVLRLTAAAAVLALVLSAAVRVIEQPSASELRADDRPTMTLDQALERLDQLDRQEDAAARRARNAEKPASSGQ
jgi:hypothetical protein